MKNKKVAYILLPLVVLIWGIIFYRIYTAVNVTNDQNNTNFETPALQKDQSVADTFHIVADYRDPFLGKAISIIDRPKTDVIKSPSVKTEKVVQVIPWPSISYGGLIKNQKTNKQLAMVQVNGQDNLIRLGDIVSNIQLTKIYKDSIEVVFQREKKTIRK